MEYWTDGNLIINSKGGLNDSDRNGRAWKIYRALNKVILNKNGNELLRLSTTSRKVSELMSFLGTHKIPYTII